MTNKYIARAGMLLEQNRYSEAEKELKLALSNNPDDPEIKALLSISLAYQGHFEQGLDLIKSALSQDADNPRYQYFLASIYYMDQDLKKAEELIRSAISIYPEEADFFALLSRIQLTNKDWKKALESAEKGLSIDSDNLNCLNCRSTALIKLDKKVEALGTIEEALKRDPENAYTHANLGWGLLEKGDSRKALEHFRKALTINPEMEFAKSGLVEALKGKYLIYRWFLKYTFWISNLKGKAQWGVIIGFYVLTKVLRLVTNSHPKLEPFITPILMLYLVFAFSTWIMGPISNLFLRLNVYGKYALTKEEILSSNLVGVSLVLGLVSGILFCVIDSAFLATMAIVGLSMMLPLSAVFNFTKGKKRNGVLFYVIALFLIGIGAIVQSYMDQNIFPGIMMIYVFGILGYQWFVNFLTIRV
jgi:tetratricopeptide (TPR) repeat protein